MRRSAIRAALVAIVEAVTVPVAAYYAGVQTLAASKSPDALSAIEACDHLVFTVELGEAIPAERGQASGRMLSPGSLQVVYRLRDGMDGAGKWADIDAANDLLEDIVAALVDEDAADFDLQLTSAGVVPVGERVDVALLDVRFSVIHQLGA